jgi:hypothetical protein
MAWGNKNEPVVLRVYDTMRSKNQLLWGCEEIGYR